MDTVKGRAIRKDGVARGGEIVARVARRARVGERVGGGQEGGKGGGREGARRGG